MTTCHHGGPDDLPAFLCRKCHPDLDATPEQRAAARVADQAALRKRLKREQRQRELRLAELKLESLTRRGEPLESSVSGKIAASVRRKIKKLRRSA